MTRIADMAAQFLSMFGMLSVLVAGKAALLDHEPWTLWAPIAGVGVASLAAMVALDKYVMRRKRRAVIAMLAAEHAKLEGNTNRD
ncbi:membrane protein [Mycobacterium phage Feyre]